MKSITIHKMEDGLSSKLDQLSKSTGKSKNKIIKEILRRALGIGKEKKGQINVSMVLGTMDESEANQIIDDLKAFDDVDLSEW